ncbi:intracellular protein transport protein USO1 [Vespula squamosa]|uniref:Intracellular protein transport protein USO1 n=1 Tax=Vespula squamosa TaxID=30214 RepID=A0ABD2BQU2_VESSQ
MTMTSMAVGPGSFVAPPAMLTPKMYHLQQPLNPPPSSPTSGKVSHNTHVYIIYVCTYISRSSSKLDQIWKLLLLRYVAFNCEIRSQVTV